MRIWLSLLFSLISLTTLHGQSIDGVYAGEFVDKKCVLTLSSFKSSVIGKIWSQYGKSSFLVTNDGGQLAGKFNMSGMSIGFNGKYVHDSLHFSYTVPVGKDSAVEYKNLFIKVSASKGEAKPDPILNGSSMDGVYSGDFMDAKCVLTLLVVNGTAVGQIWSAQHGKSSFVGTCEGTQLMGTFNLPKSSVDFTGLYSHDSLYISHLIPGRKKTVEVKNTFIKVSSIATKVRPERQKREKREGLVGKWKLLMTIETSGVVAPAFERQETEYFDNGKFIQSNDQLDFIASQSAQFGIKTDLQTTYVVKDAKIIKSLSSYRAKLSRTIIVDFKLNGDTLKTKNDSGRTSVWLRID